MNATIPADCAKNLGLEIVGDQAAVTVVDVNSDGSVSVTAEQEETDTSPEPSTIPGSKNPALGNLSSAQDMPAGMMSGGMMGAS